MNIYPSTQAKPYVYICTHRGTQNFYIGYREYNVALGKPSTTDLPTYRTSSKHVRSNFDQFDWQIIAEFNNGEDAYLFEQQLIQQHWGNPLLLNEQYRIPNGKSSFKSKKGTLVGRKNPAVSLSNKKRTPWNKGLTKADPRVASNIAPPSEDRIKKFSEFMIEYHKTKPKLTCEHCNKQLDSLNFKKWHGANCKFAPH